MAVQALVAAEIFYLLSISQLVPSIWSRLHHREQSEQQAIAELATGIAYPSAIGIVCVVILQILFSQWTILNPLLDTTPLNSSQGLICVILGLPVGFLGCLFKRFDSL